MCGDQNNNNNLVLDVDSIASDADSSYGDEVSTFSESLASSVYNFVEEYGRVYHSFRDFAGNCLPSDERETDRLDIHHALMLALLDGKLHWAPIGKNPQRVLDIGTGTGLWAIDFADLYPSAEVIGNDITPIQPSNVPPNLKFVIDDIEDEWGKPGTPVESTKPGGWVEFQEWDPRIYSTDGSLTENHSLYQFCKMAVDRRSEAGYPASPGPDVEQWMKDAGFINIHVHKLPIPLGPWAKDKKYKRIGVWNYAQAEAGLEGIAIGCLIKSPSKQKAWTMEEVNVLLAKTREDMKNRRLHGQYDFYVVYGQRPDP
ncbi:hypothetical protein FQN57_000361 [Myotisia sp. PD_48]|nr:hypothetical protein FQN57_000361 [Myotisia sp. PD_48]